MRKSLYACAAIVAACLSLSTAYASDNEAVEYEPTRRGSRTGVLKTAIMGLAMMSMPESVKAQAIPVPTPGTVYGFGDCYLGTIDPTKSTDMNNITIKTIKSAPCNLYYDYPPNEFKDISMIISTTCLPQVVLTSSNHGNTYYNHCESITINQISMLNQNFKVQYSGELKWNYQNNNNYTQFSLYLYNSPYTLFPNYIPSYQGPNNYIFAQAFRAYMDHGQGYSPSSRLLLSTDNQEANDTDY